MDKCYPWVNPIWALGEINITNIFPFDNLLITDQTKLAIV